jgi:SAM-dependent methyltransferase
MTKTRLHTEPPTEDIGQDRPTLDAYDRAASTFAEDWDAQPTPDDMYDTLRRYFSPGPTADIGCGSGRDTAWLNAKGYEATGYDGSEGLLAEARRRYPGLPFRRATLPTLPGVAAESFRNVLCETVIMHLPPDAITPSVERLLAILRPGGTLYLTWRIAAGADTRDAHGRLYAAFPADLVLAALGPADVVLDEERISASSGKPIHRIVARKRDGGAAGNRGAVQ